jgi:hypothetical protein
MQMCNKACNSSEIDKNQLLANIYQAIQQVKYGSVQIHIQDGKVIQIDRLDKIRMR